MVTFPKSAKTFPEPYGSYNVKENHIGSVVSEILLYRHTHRQTSLYFIIVKENHIGSVVSEDCFTLRFSKHDLR